MNVVIPPLIFYVIGAMFVAFGTLRALMLGRRRPARELGEDTPALAKARRYHVKMGVVWILMGIFLIATTAGVIKFRLPI
jgi:hypothetical protein